MFGQPRMPKPKEAAEILIKTLIKAHDDPTIADVRHNGMPLNLLAVNAGFAQMTGEELSPALVRDGVYPSLRDFSTAIEEAQLRSWVSLDADKDVRVRVRPAGLDHGRLFFAALVSESSRVFSFRAIAKRDHRRRYSRGHYSRQQCYPKALWLAMIGSCHDHLLVRP